MEKQENTGEIVPSKVFTSITFSTKNKPVISIKFHITKGEKKKMAGQFKYEIFQFLNFFH